VIFLVPDVDSTMTACAYAGEQVFGLRKSPRWHQFFIRPRTACETLAQAARDMTRWPQLDGKIDDVVAVQMKDNYGKSARSAGRSFRHSDVMLAYPTASLQASDAVDRGPARLSH
jgi:hypothetical protein